MDEECEVKSLEVSLSGEQGNTGIMHYNSIHAPSKVKQSVTSECHCQLKEMAKYVSKNVIQHF